jgi:hypothetical protein
MEFITYYTKEHFFLQILDEKILKESNFLLFVKKKRRLGFPFASRNDIDDQN